MLIWNIKLPTVKTLKLLKSAKLLRLDQGTNVEYNPFIILPPLLVVDVKLSSLNGSLGFHEWQL